MSYVKYIVRGMIGPAEMVSVDLDLALTTARYKSESGRTCHVYKRSVNAVELTEVTLAEFIDGRGTVCIDAADPDYKMTAKFCRQTNVDYAFQALLVRWGVEIARSVDTNKGRVMSGIAPCDLHNLLSDWAAQAVDGGVEINDVFETKMAEMFELAKQEPSGKLGLDELARRNDICEECMSELCIFASGGYCRYPLVHGCAPEQTLEDGCLAYAVP